MANYDRDDIPAFACLGCGQIFDDEGVAVILIPRDGMALVIEAAYQSYRAWHDQLRRYSQTEEA